MNEIEMKNHLINNQDLDEFLIEKGVSRDNIEASKKDIIYGIDDFRLYCDKTIVEEGKLVPTKYIVHPTRGGNIGYSWYELLEYAFKDFTKDTLQSTNIAPERLLSLLVRNFVNEYQNFEYWNRLFADKKSGMANFNFDMYDLGEGQVPLYFQTGGNGGGTHRLILAKVTGVDYIFANEIYVYKINQQKKSLYDQIGNLENQLKEFINESLYFELGPDSKNLYLRKNKEGKLKIFLGEGLRKLDEVDYCSEEYINDYINYLEFLTSNLNEIEKRLNEKKNFYKFLPRRILSIMCGNQNYIKLKDIQILNNKKEILKEIRLQLAYVYKLENHS